MPLVSYDYQGAISEFGELPRKYHVLKLAHYFIQDFGSTLAPMIPSMPSKVPAGVQDANTFRCMVRSDKNSGYLFFNNYQRYVENKDLENIQVQVKLDDATVTIPSKPITIPKNAFGIWPINLNMNGAILEYATAQMVARFPGKDADTYFFFAHNGIAPELSFRTNTITGINAGKNQVSKNSGQTSVLISNPGMANTIEVKSATGQKIRICVLPYELALHATRLDFRGAPRLIITDGANAISNSGSLDILSSGAASGALWIFPSPATIRMTGKTIKGKDEGIFRKFEWSVKQKDISVALKQISKEDTSKYEVSIPSDALEDVYDVQLDIDHTCNYLTAKLGRSSHWGLVLYRNALSPQHSSLGQAGAWQNNLIRINAAYRSNPVLY